MQFRSTLRRVSSKTGFFSFSLGLTSGAEHHAGLWPMPLSTLCLIMFVGDFEVFVYGISIDWVIWLGTIVVVMLTPGLFQVPFELRCDRALKIPDPVVLGLSVGLTPSSNIFFRSSMSYFWIKWSIICVSSIILIALVLCSFCLTHPLTISSIYCKVATCLFFACIKSAFHLTLCVVNSLYSFSICKTTFWMSI